MKVEKRFLVSLMAFALSIAGVAMLVGSQSGPPEPKSRDFTITGQEIEISPAAAHRIKLAVVELKLAPEPVVLHITGKTALNLERVVHIKPQFPGKLMTIGPALGSEVKGPEGPAGSRGTFLCTVESVDLGNAKNAYQKASTQLGLDVDTMNKIQELVDAKVLADRFLKEAKAAVTKDQADVEVARQNLFVFGVREEELQRIPGQERWERMAYDLSSPISGLIVEKNVTRGEYADSTVNLFTIANTSTLWVWGDVYEKDWEKVKAGQKIKVQIAAYPDRSYEAKLDMISPALDPVTRGIRVRGTLENPDGKILADMYCNLLVTVGEGVNSLVAPAEAVVRGLQADEAYVFVRKSPAQEGGGATFERRSVRVEEIDPTRVRILEGAKAGAVVVTKGAPTLYDEMRRK
jgi:multidrug efflux pump subunit AcrA (membrane-fusion protein)